MDAKKRLEYCIGEIKESNISDKTKKILIRLFMEIWPEYDSTNLCASVTYMYFPFEKGEFLSTVPDWLYDIFGIYKTRFKHSFNGNYGYALHVPDYLFKSTYNFLSKFELVEETEANNSMDLVKSEKLSKDKSLDELKKLKKKLERELGIVTKAIDIKKNEKDVSRQKVYKK